MTTNLARVLPTVAVAIAAVTLLQPATAWGQAEPQRVPAALMARAEAQGRVRVIVGVAVDFALEAQLPDQAAVGFQRANISAFQDIVLGQLTGTYVASIRRFRTVPYLVAEVDAAALRVLDSSTLVTSVEEDVRVPPLLVDTTPLIGATDAWAAGYTGSGWTVAILDTGVDKTHSFLSGKVVSEACYSTTFGSTITSLCPGGLDSTAPGSGVSCTGISGCDHGTHVAGIAAGSGSSFSGVAKGASLIAVQVFSRVDSSSTCGGTAPCVLSYTSDQIAGLERVYALRSTYNIASVNMSIGGDAATSPCDGDSRKAIIDQLRGAGIATVIASGNDGWGDALSYPACISTAISVASTTKSDAVSNFSNTASFLSLLAPGSSVYSSVPGSSFLLKSGTSMAAPHVAGAWAVLKQRKPTGSVSQILTAFQDTGVGIVDPLNGLTFKRIRVKAALDALLVAQMSVDTPQGGTVVQPFNLAGWAIDLGAASGTGVNAIHVWAYPSGGGSPAFAGSAAYGGARPDVGVLFGSQFTNSGFSLVVKGLTPGPYQLVAYAYSTVSGSFNNAQAVTVTVQANPHMAVDVPADGSTVNPGFLVSGWAVDLAAASGSGVDAIHVWAYPSGGGSPSFLGATTADWARPDVGAVFGSPFTNSGYGLTTPFLSAGTYQIVVYAHSTVAGTFNQQGSVTVTVRDSDPLMAVDVPAYGSSVSQPFVVAGWAIDRVAPSGTGVDAIHVWAYPAGGGSPQFAGVASYGGARFDVGAVFGSQFTNSGYGLLVSVLPSGTYDLVVYAHSTVTGTFNNAQLVRVTVN